MEQLIEGYLSSVELFINDLMTSSEKFKEAVIRVERLKTSPAPIRRFISKAKEKRLIQRRITTYDPNNWWEIFVQEHYPQQKCIEAFKCSRETYIYLVKALRPYLNPKQSATQVHASSKMLKGISVEKQVALTLHRLSHCKDYGEMAKMFGMHRSTTQKMIFKVIAGVNKHLLFQEIKMPKSNEAVNIAQNFEEKTRIPQILGALDCTHIPCVPSPTMVKEFTNSKKYSSFVLQTITDCNFCFRDVSIRHCGGRDSRLVLEDSHIFKFGESILPPETKNILGVDVQYKIVGSNVYPQLPWLVTGYPRPSVGAEVVFNSQLEKILNYSNQAIARLRARFIILCKTIDASFRTSPSIIAACCALHNICEKNNDPFHKKWLEEAEKLCQKFPQPDKSLDFMLIPRQKDIDQRDALRDQLETRFLLFESDVFEGHTA